MDVSFQLIGREDQWNLSKREIIIGRDPACDLVIPAEFVTVSRRHCKMNVLASEWTVEDNNSANGIYLNGMRVQVAKVYPGDTIQLGANGPELRVDLGMGAANAAGSSGDRGSRSATIMARRILADEDSTHVYASSKSEQEEESQPAASAAVEAAPPAPEPFVPVIDAPPAVAEIETEMKAETGSRVEAEPEPEPEPATLPDPMPMPPDLAPYVTRRATAALTDAAPLHTGATRVADASELGLPTPAPAARREAAATRIGSLEQLTAGDAPRKHQTVMMSAPPAQKLETPASPWKARPAVSHEDPLSVSGLYRGLTPEEEEMLEKQLKSLKVLMTTCLVIIVVLAGVVFYQQQQISNNRQTLIEMRAQAENAVGQFTPELDRRLSRFEQRMDVVQEQMNGIDGKMRAAEDRFVSRLNAEVPAVLDRYIEKKSREMNTATPAK